MLSIRKLFCVFIITWIFRRRKKMKAWRLAKFYLASRERVDDKLDIQYAIQQVLNWEIRRSILFFRNDDFKSNSHQKLNLIPTVTMQWVTDSSRNTNQLSILPPIKILNKVINRSGYPSRVAFNYVNAKEHWKKSEQFYSIRFIDSQHAPSVYCNLICLNSPFRSRRSDTCFCKILFFSIIAVVRLISTTVRLRVKWSHI